MLNGYELQVLGVGMESKGIVNLASFCCGNADDMKEQVRKLKEKEDILIPMRDAGATQEELNAKMRELGIKLEGDESFWY